MTVLLVEQNFLASQRKTLQEQLQDVGIRVTMNGRKGVVVLGYVDTLTTTQTPMKAKLRYDEGVDTLSPSQEKGFTFVIRNGRFVLHKGKGK